MELPDVFYQMDSIYIRKAIYKGKPKYPITPRKPNIVVNVREEAPMWKDIAPVKRYFEKLVKPKSYAQFVTFAQMKTDAILSLLKDTDVFVTCYGDESAFVIFLVPYSVLIEVQPDYFHDSTTSVMAYAADVYPVVLRDVYSQKPKECRVVEELVMSEEEPCRSILMKRIITFDIKSMTQAMAQTIYYLNNYKMKIVKYWLCLLRIAHAKTERRFGPHSLSSLPSSSYPMVFCSCKTREDPCVVLPSDRRRSRLDLNLEDIVCSETLQEYRELLQTTQSSLDQLKRLPPISSEAKAVGSGRCNRL